MGSAQANKTTETNRKKRYTLMLDAAAVGRIIFCWQRSLIHLSLSISRALAGIKQEELAKAASLHVNSIRYMERKDHITNTWSTIKRVVAALEGFGVVLVSDPTPGVCLNR